MEIGKGGCQAAGGRTASAAASLLHHCTLLSSCYTNRWGYYRGSRSQQSCYWDGSDLADWTAATKKLAIYGMA